MFRNHVPISLSVPTALFSDNPPRNLHTKVKVGVSVSVKETSVPVVYNLAVPFFVFPRMSCLIVTPERVTLKYPNIIDILISPEVDPFCVRDCAKRAIKRVLEQLTSFPGVIDLAAPFSKHALLAHYRWNWSIKMWQNLAHFK